MLSTFAVDDVEAVLTRLPSRSFRERFPGIIDCASARFIETGEAHPLIAAVHLAFSEHRPLVLTPDAVWLTIAQGFAQHVRLNSEGLRNRFVGRSGKKALIVEHPSPKLPEMVPIIEMFRRKLAEELGPGLTRLMICDFSTTTDVERTASAVILMDTFQPYYEYVLRCICGIPQITVTGTEQDWRAIGERVRILGEYDLLWWTTHVEKIVGQLQRARSHIGYISLSRVSTTHRFTSTFSRICLMKACSLFHVRLIARHAVGSSSIFHRGQLPKEPRRMGNTRRRRWFALSATLNGSATPLQKS